MLTRWTWEHMSNVFFVSFRRPRYGQQISVESQCSTNMRPTPPSAKITTPSSRIPNQISFQLFNVDSLLVVKNP